MNFSLESLLKAFYYLESSTLCENKTSPWSSTIRCWENSASNRQHSLILLYRSRLIRRQQKQFQELFREVMRLSIGKLILSTFVSCTASTAKHKEHEILESRKAKLINFSGVSPHVVSNASRLELCTSPITNSHVTINTLSASEPSLWLIMSTWSRQIFDD